MLKDRIPYTYQVTFHKEDSPFNGMKYIGAKWAKQCNPKLFWKKYFTSSTIIHKLIKEYGISSFEYQIIKSNYETISECIADEERMLIEVDAKNNPLFFNHHNGDGNFHAQYLAKDMYERSKKTNVIRYGFENPGSNKKVRDKAAQTNLIEFGCENPFQSEEIKEKIMKSNLENNGVKYPMQSRDIQEKSCQTNLKNLGVKYPSQSKEVRKKIIQSNLNNFGYKHPSQCPAINQKKIDTRRKHCKKIICIEDKKLFELQDDVVNYYNISPQQISNILNKYQKSTHGLHFQYLDGEIIYYELYI